MDLLCATFHSIQPSLSKCKQTRALNVVSDISWHPAFHAGVRGAMGDARTMAHKRAPNTISEAVRGVGT
jgi:hypothetical protein